MNNYEKLWNLFKKTGDIRYFLLAKSIKESEGSENNEDSRREGTSFKRNQL